MRKQGGMILHIQLVNDKYFFLQYTKQDNGFNSILRPELLKGTKVIYWMMQNKQARNDANSQICIMKIQK